MDDVKRLGYGIDYLFISVHRKAGQYLLLQQLYRDAADDYYRKCFIFIWHFIE